MITITKRPAAWMGALIGAITMPAVIAVFYLGDRFAGLNFVPFDVFDFVARVLPGGLITFGIDTMVAILMGLGFGASLDSAAKSAEQFIGLAMFFSIGVAAAWLYFALMNRFAPPQRSAAPAGVLALAFGLPLTFISLAFNRTASVEPLLGAAWALLITGGWGIVVGALYDALCGFATAQDLGATTSGMDRRQFLVSVGGASAVLTIAGVGIAELLAPAPQPVTVAANPGETASNAASDLPNANDPVQPAPGTRPEVTPVEDHYRIDISSRPPVIEEATYRLRIFGAVANPVEWTLDEIRAMDSMSAYITMSCISNPIGGSLISTTKWTGVSFQKILEMIQPNADAVALYVRGADGFDEYIDLGLIRDDERVMLCYAWADAPLPVQNGFPLRTHIPNRYGMKQPKWITDIEVVTQAGEGYWVRRGWSEEALVRATSVVDTIAADAVYEAEGALYVPVGGIAWAGDRAISRVEVRVNDGEWQEARIRAPLSDRTWVIWRYDWPFQEGRFNFEVRCTEANGTPQLEGDRPVRPDGATGIHNKRAELKLPA